MEFADGGDLYQKITIHKQYKKYFEEDEIWSLLIQITRALHTLHEMKIFHRDLKVHWKLLRALTCFLQKKSTPN